MLKKEMEKKSPRAEERKKRNITSAMTLDHAQQKQKGK